MVSVAGSAVPFCAKDHAPGWCSWVPRLRAIYDLTLGSQYTDVSNFEMLIMIIKSS
jgi:hypothetical protein